MILNVNFQVGLSLALVLSAGHTRVQTSFITDVFDRSWIALTEHIRSSFTMLSVSRMGFEVASVTSLISAGKERRSPRSYLIGSIVPSEMVILERDVLPAASLPEI